MSCGWVGYRDGNDKSCRLDSNQLSSSKNPEFEVFYWEQDNNMGHSPQPFCANTYYEETPHSLVVGDHKRALYAPYLMILESQQGTVSVLHRVSKEMSRPSHFPVGTGIPAEKLAESATVAWCQPWFFRFLLHGDEQHTTSLLRYLLEPS